jgi:hypothetical protein
VSHDTNTIATFCDHAILLENGQIHEQGEPRHISMVYYRLVFGEPEGAPHPPASEAPGGERGPAHTVEAVVDHPERAEQGVLAGRPAAERDALVAVALERLGTTAAGVGALEVRAGTRTKAEIIDFGIRDEDGNRVTILESGRPYTLFLIAVFHDNIERPGFGFLIRNAKGVDMFGVDTRGPKLALRPHRRGEVLEGLLHIRLWLTNGEYFLSAGIGDTEGASFDFRYDGLVFTIPNLPEIQHASVVNLQHRFEFSSHDFGLAGGRVS